MKEICLLWPPEIRITLIEVYSRYKASMSFRGSFGLSYVVQNTFGINLHMLIHKQRGNGGSILGQTSDSGAAQRSVIDRQQIMARHGSQAVMKEKLSRRGSLSQISLFLMVVLWQWTDRK